MTNLIIRLAVDNSDRFFKFNGRQYPISAEEEEGNWRGAIELPVVIMQTPETYPTEREAILAGRKMFAKGEVPFGWL